MLQLKCTKKLLEFIGEKPVPFPEKANETILGGWHANVVDFMRPRLVVFLNDATLFCLVDVVDPEYERINLALIFRKNLLRVLQENQATEALINRISKDYSESVITKTDSRKTLGNMNDIMNQIYFHIERADEENSPVILRNLGHDLNSIPQRNINWGLSKDVFKQLLDAS